MALSDLTTSPFYRGPRRVLSLLETEQARADGTLPALMRAGLWPAMAGADDDDGGSDDGGGDDDGGSDDDSGSQQQQQQSRARGQQTQRSQSDDDDGSDDDDDGDDDDANASEVARLKRQLSEANKRARRMERKQAQAEKQQRESDGEYQKLYEQEKSRADGLESKLKAGARDRAILSQAQTMQADDVEVVVMLAQRELDVEDVVDEDGEVDEQQVEKALKAIKKRKPALFREPRRAQSDTAGRGDNNGDAGRRRRGRLEDDAFAPRERMSRGYANTT